MFSGGGGLKREFAVHDKKGKPTLRYLCFSAWIAAIIARARFESGVSKSGS